MNDPIPHYLRVARGLALVSALSGAAGCASAVYPYDPDGGDAEFVSLPDGAIQQRGDSGLLANGCPRARPYPYGAPCDSPGLVCDPDVCLGLECRAAHDGGAPIWTQRTVCNGPLVPPEECAGA